MTELNESTVLFAVWAMHDVLVHGKGEDYRPEYLMSTANAQLQMTSLLRDLMNTRNARASEYGGVEIYESTARRTIRAIEFLDGEDD